MMSEFSYQPYYCEENVWHLCREDVFEGERAYAVVISNEAGACALWNQRAAPSPGRPVFWDYHAVALAGESSAVRVWDLDSRLETPVSFEEWWRGTFPALEAVPPEFHPVFRVVPAREYLEIFSSDRSHMRTEEGDWREPPPEWPAIFDPERGMNLPKLVDMSAEFVGDVCTGDELRERFAGRPSV